LGVELWLKKDVEYEPRRLHKLFYTIQVISVLSD
jgi:hypothetical protein